MDRTWYIKTINGMLKDMKNEEIYITIIQLLQKEKKYGNGAK